MVDTTDLKSVGLYLAMWVQVPPSPFFKDSAILYLYLIYARKKFFPFEQFQK